MTDGYLDAIADIAGIERAEQKSHFSGRVYTLHVELETPLPRNPMDTLAELEATRPSGWHLPRLGVHGGGAMYIEYVRLAGENNG